MFAAGGSAVFVKLGGLPERFTAHCLSAAGCLGNTFEFACGLGHASGLEISNRKFLSYLCRKFAVGIVAAEILKHCRCPVPGLKINKCCRRIVIRRRTDAGIRHDLADTLEVRDRCLEIAGVPGVLTLLVY